MPFPFTVQGLLLYGISFLYSGDSHEDFIATWSSDEVADWIIAEFPPWGVRLAEEMKEEVGLLHWPTVGPKIGLLSWLKHVGYTVLLYQLKGGAITVYPTVGPVCSVALHTQGSHRLALTSYPDSITHCTPPSALM